MKTVKYFFILLISLSACKDKPFTTTITGHVFNQAENKDYANGEILLVEFDNGIEGNSNVVGTAYTDANGNFSISFKCIKLRSYSVFTQPDNLVISGFEGYKGLIEGVDFKGNQIPSKIGLTCATKAFIVGDLIHNLGNDSMHFQFYHQHYAFVNPKTYIYTGEEIKGYEFAMASGSWVYVYDRFKNGVKTTEVDTFYLAPNSHTIKNIQY
jgi:hypothetical protein